MMRRRVFPAARGGPKFLGGGRRPRKRRRTSSIPDKIGAPRSFIRVYCTCFPTVISALQLLEEGLDPGVGTTVEPSMEFGFEEEARHLLPL